MSSSIEIKESEASPIALRSKQMDLDAGWLGRCFGAGRNAPMNIAGSLVLILVGSGVGVLFLGGSIPAGEYWRIIVPLLTLVMGYIFGKGTV